MRAAFAGLLGTTKCAECSRCGGTGRIQHFSWYANGVCFWCKGTGCEPKDPPKGRGRVAETTPRMKKPWQVRDSSGYIALIKNWLRHTFESAGGYDSFESPDDFEKQRWFQIALNLQYLAMASDQTLYARSVKRAFEYARASSWKKAAATLDMDLGTQVTSMYQYFDVPSDVSFDVPGVFRYSL